MIDKRIGRRIKERREELGMTQAEFAEKLGVATNYISTVERGASFPRCENLIAIRCAGSFCSLSGFHFI